MPADVRRSAVPILAVAARPLAQTLFRNPSMTNFKRLTRRALCVASGVAVLPVAALPAQAPDTAQRVVVTGSALAQAADDSSGTIQVITAEDIRRSARTSVQEVLQNLTATGAGTLSQSFPGSFAAGAAGVSLRGLTVGSTLVLIDGLRMAPFPIGDDGQRSFVDIASLPLEAVDRIEVLKDGGAAIYGSDAIAGVVNVILKRSFVGATMTGDLGTSQLGGGTLRRAAFLYGSGDLDADGHNVYLTGEFRRQDPIRLAQRGSLFTQTDYRASGGDDTTLGSHAFSTSGPPYSATGYVTNPDGSIAGFMKGCDATRFAADQCTYRDTWHQILPPTRNANLTGRLTQSLGPDWQLTLDAAWFDSQSEQLLQPARTFSSGDQGIVFGPGEAPTLLAALAPTTIASTNPSFPAGTGLARGDLVYTFLDLGPRTTRTDARTTRLVGAAKGRAGAWQIEAALGYSQVVLAQVSTNFVSAANLQTALDSLTDPYLVGGPDPASVDAFIAPRQAASSLSRLGLVHVDATRDIATLPGGAWSAAVGADQVFRTQHAVSAAGFADGLVDGGNAYAIGRQDVSSLHAETIAPVSRSLELDAAVRYDHYNISGGRTSPQLGFRYAPFAALSFHGTASRGFRAPGPDENGNAGQAYTAGRISDPVLCADGNAATAGNFPQECRLTALFLQTTNRHLRAETSKNTTLGLTLQPLPGMSAALTAYSIEVDHQIVVGPASLVRGTNLAPIGQLQSDGSTVLVVPPVAPIAYAQTPYVNADQTITSGLELEVKGRRRIAGLGDFSSDLMVTHVARYDLTVDGHTYRLAGTHGPSTVSGDTGNPRTRIQWANTFARDAWDMTATLNFVGSYGVTDPSTAAVFGVGETDCASALNDDGGQGGLAYATAVGNGQPPSSLCRVRSFTSVDLSGRAALTRQLSLHGAILNLFNSGPPHDWASYGGAGAPYNPALHLSGAIGRYFTAGAAYTF